MTNNPLAATTGPEQAIPGNPDKSRHIAANENGATAAVAMLAAGFFALMGLIVAGIPGLLIGGALGFVAGIALANGDDSGCNLLAICCCWLSLFGGGRG